MKSKILSENLIQFCPTWMTTLTAVLKHQRRQEHCLSYLYDSNINSVAFFCKIARANNLWGVAQQKAKHLCEEKGWFSRFTPLLISYLATNMDRIHISFIKTTFYKEQVR